MKNLLQNKNLKKQKTKENVQEIEDTHISDMLKQVDSKFSVFNRKSQRKIKKEQKKQQKQDFFSRKKQNKNINKQQKAKESNQIQEKTEQQQHQKSVQRKTEQIQNKKKEQNSDLQRLQNQIQQDDEEIKYYEKLLGKGRSKTLDKRVKRELKQDGWTDDFMDFLDNISVAVKKNVNEYQPFFKDEEGLENEEVEEEEELYDEEEEELDYEEEDELDDEEEEEEEEENQQQLDEKQEQEVDQEKEEEEEEIEDEEEEIEDEEEEIEDEEEEEEEIEHEEEIDYEEEIDDEEEEIDQEEENEIKNNNDKKEKQIKSILKKDTNFQNKQTQNTKEKQELDNQRQEKQEQYEKQDIEKKKEIRLSLVKNFNKISETNIDIIFQEIVILFEKYPKNLINPIFSDIFLSTTIFPVKVLPYILACNSVVVSGIHQIFDNENFAPIMKSLLIEYEKIINQKQLFEQEGNKYEEELLFNKLRNITIIFLIFTYSIVSVFLSFEDFTIIYSQIQTKGQQKLFYYLLSIQARKQGMIILLQQSKLQTRRELVQKNTKKNQKKLNLQCLHQMIFVQIKNQSQILYKDQNFLLIG
ncbi:ma3 domain protein [Ichthyophthirius multifiliis]|uniref:Ma3 domain protein n=1 Tax=Ichthyophthirius multifiliis TaxID=5932 RepID=G0R383_ICHMU|nr:ma3 domain protein [Ichthyophthirius multifiliis]EGR28057.1 ma3 domain protein [Ichthyophthirius multifiliis]|eukprot:XP_004027402.1 ma3 domain protein [Ichthyophthirius multifiliis]